MPQYNLRNIIEDVSWNKTTTARSIVRNDIDPGAINLNFILRPGFSLSDLRAQSKLFSKHIVSSSPDLRYVLGNRQDTWGYLLENMYIYSFIKMRTLGILNKESNINSNVSYCFIGHYLDYKMLRKHSFINNASGDKISFQRVYIGRESDLDPIKEAFPRLFEECFIQTEGMVSFHNQKYENFFTRMKEQKWNKSIIINACVDNDDYDKFVNMESNCPLGNSYYSLNMKNLFVVSSPNEALRSDSILLNKALFIISDGIKVSDDISINYHDEFALPQNINVNACYEVQSVTDLYVRGFVANDNESDTNFGLEFKSKGGLRNSFENDEDDPF